MITELLNDATPAQIRKSIFLSASIIIFACTYQLNIELPEMFQALNETNKTLTIRQHSILLVLSTCQVYLLVRLHFSNQISEAYNKNLTLTDEAKESKQEKTKRMLPMKLCGTEKSPDEQRKEDVASDHRRQILANNNKIFKERKFEIKYFELYIPYAIGGASIVLALYNLLPYFIEWCERFHTPL